MVLCNHFPGGTWGQGVGGTLKESLNIYTFVLLMILWDVIP